MKTILKLFGLIIAVVALFIGGYIAYVYLQYYRIPDNKILNIEKLTPRITPEITVGDEYSIATFNIGYGSYPPDFTFFMDGGDEVRARSKKSVTSAIKQDINLMQGANPDLINIQEIDWDGDRSKQVNEPRMMKKGLINYQSVLAQNYDSAYLFYPINDPIGKAKSGIMTFSKYQIKSARRFKLPIETNFNKFFDLDRAFSVSILPINNSSKKLVIFNTHMSAYTKDVSVQEAQFKKLFKKMNDYVSNGDYVIVGGDYNHTLAGKARNELTWMKQFPTEDIPNGVRIVAPDNAPTVRSNGVKLNDSKEITGIIDGFLVSSNIQDLSVSTIDNGFKSSDHNPVIMKFKLQ